MPLSQPQKTAWTGFGLLVIGLLSVAVLGFTAYGVYLFTSLGVYSAYGKSNLCVVTLEALTILSSLFYMWNEKYLARFFAAALGAIVLVHVCAGFYFWYHQANASHEMEKIRNTGKPAKVNIVVIIVDGARPDAYRRAGAPNILRLRNSGSYTMNAKTIFPSWTGPAHVSLGTGLGPDKHGFKNNDINTDVGTLRAVKRYLSGEIKTVLDYGKQGAGLKTVVVAEDNPRTKSRVTKMLARNIDVRDHVNGGSEEIMKQAATYLNDPAYLLLGIHLPEVDKTGHEFGWMSPEQLEAVKVVDGAIGNFMRALKKSSKAKNTYIILTSDHGGSGLDHGSDSPEDMTIPWIIFGPDVKNGYKIKSEVRIYDTAATILHILGIPIPADWDGQPVLEVFRGPRH
jgi:hypothetical protein